MSTANDAGQIGPLVKEPIPSYPKKRRFARGVKDQNKAKTKKPVSKGCFNCSHHLKKYYYWKQNPCDICLRSPAFFYHLPSMELVDNWEPAPSNWTSRRNLLY